MPVVTDGVIITDKAEAIRARAMDQISQNSSEESIAKKQQERAELFEVGMRFLHDIHGAGTVVAIQEDGKRRMKFDSGSVHAYKPTSMHKLKPIMSDQVHTYTPEMLFKMVDTDNSGELNLDEFKVLHEIIVKDEQTRANKKADLTEETIRAKAEIVKLRKIALAAFLFCLAFLGVIGGMTVAVVKAFKDTEQTETYATLRSADGTPVSKKNTFLADTVGNVMETAPAVVSLPMLAAPVLKLSQLNSLSQLTFSYRDLGDENSPTHNVQLKVIEEVTSVVKVNNTCVIFKTSGGTAEEVHVCDGTAWAVLPEYATYVLPNGVTAGSAEHRLDWVTHTQSNGGETHRGICEG